MREPQPLLRELFLVNPADSASSYGRLGRSKCLLSSEERRIIPRIDGAYPPCLSLNPGRGGTPCIAIWESPAFCCRSLQSSGRPHCGRTTGTTRKRAPII